MSQGGPVADWVHFHRVALQLIYVRCGWVRVVYEDQGEPFVMQPGALSRSLLGMSALSRLGGIHISDGRLVLQR